MEIKLKKLLVFIVIILSVIGIKAEGEALLKNIRVNGQECKCIEYKCEIEVNSNSATVTYELVDSSATVDRQSGFTKELTSPTTLVKVVVSNTVNDEKQENTYEITINQHEKSSDNTLSILKVNDNEIKLVEDIIAYSYEAKFDEEKLVVKAITTDPNAKINSDLEYDFPLDSSSMAIDIEIKAENGDIKTYRMTWFKT